MFRHILIASLISAISCIAAVNLSLAYLLGIAVIFVGLAVFFNVFFNVFFFIFLSLIPLIYINKYFSIKEPYLLILYLVVGIIIADIYLILSLINASWNYSEISWLSYSIYSFIGALAAFSSWYYLCKFKAYNKSFKSVDAKQLRCI